jgi:hypothetical protein
MVGKRITATFIAPSFMTAAMFLILPKVINELAPIYSRMPPRLCEFAVAGYASFFT